MAFIMLISCMALAEEDAGQAETAVEITKKAKITVSAHKNDKGYLTDGNIRETWFDEGRGYMEFTLPKETPCWGIYIQFDTILDTALQIEDENGEWADAELLPGDYYNKYVPLEGLTHFRIQNKSGKDKKHPCILIRNNLIKRFLCKDWSNKVCQSGKCTHCKCNNHRSLIFKDIR